MVDQQLGVDAKQFIQTVRVTFRNTLHGGDAAIAQPIGCAGADPPEVGKGLMLPQLFLIASLRQFRNTIRGVFCLNIKGHFRKIQIGPDAAGGQCSNCVPDVRNDLRRQLPGCEVVHPKIRRDIDEGFINGVHINVFGSKVFEKHPVNLRRAVDIELHLRRRNNHTHVWGYIPQTAAVFYPLLFAAYADRKTDGIL